MSAVFSYSLRASHVSVIAVLQLGQSSAQILVKDTLDPNVLAIHHLDHPTPSELSRKKTAGHPETQEKVKLVQEFRQNSEAVRCIVCSDV